MKNCGILAVASRDGLHRQVNTDGVLDIRMLLIVDAHAYLPV